MPHKLINLKLRERKLNYVYEYIYDWINIPVSNDEKSFYLIFHAKVNWCEEPIFCLAMQRSKNIGIKVDVSEPVHIPERDIANVNYEWNRFICKRKGKKEF